MTSCNFGLLNRNVYQTKTLSSLNSGRGDPGPNLGIGRLKMFTSWRWQTKYTPYYLCKFVNTSPKSEPTLELHSRAAPSVETHHCASGPNTGRNSGGKWKTKKTLSDTPTSLPPLSHTYALCLVCNPPPLPLIEWRHLWMFCYLKVSASVNPDCATDSRSKSVNLFSGCWEALVIVLGRVLQKNLSV